MTSAGRIPRAFYSLTACFLGLAVHAANLTIQVRVPADSGTVYLAGNIPALGPWDPHKFPMHGDGTNRTATIDLPNGAALEFKFTRGSWETVETTSSGGSTTNRIWDMPASSTNRIWDMPASSTNRIWDMPASSTNQIWDMPALGDTIYSGAVEAWASGKSAPKKSTATASVSILSTNFFMPQIGRSRRVWLYLPPDYANSTKTYPVLYMHDGQNVFDDATSFAGEWGVDETLDQLHAHGDPGCIVVAIDNDGPHRMTEYQPDFHSSDDGEGGRYVNFIVQTLKPYIDRHYRTRPGRLNTAIGGSSMGGLISLYAVLKYPDVFGRALLFSTSFQVKPELFDFARPVKSPPPPSRLYFLCGQKETTNPNFVSAPQTRMAGLLATNGFTVRSVISPDGQHAEWFWRREFPSAYQWLFPSAN
jgi:metallo-beta-lactamase class B